MNAVSILEKSIADIEAGRWVCSALCEVNGNGIQDKSELRHMACAVGLVAIYAKHTRVKKIRIKGNKYVPFDFALYPEHKNPKTKKFINAYGKKALRFLYLATPKHYHAYSPISELTLTEISQNVVEYNDNYVNDSSEALEWFQEALRLAKVDAERKLAKKESKNA